MNILHCFVIDKPYMNNNLRKTLRLSYKRLDPLHDYIFDDNIDSLLRKIDNDIDYAVVHWEGSVIDKPIDLLDTTRKQIEENPDTFIHGHIMQRHSYYFLFPITLIINMKIYRELNRPSFGDRNLIPTVIDAIRSEENIHDNYTPLYLTPGKQYITTKNPEPGWNFINVSLKNDIKVLNVGSIIRECKTYIYPDIDTEQFNRTMDKFYELESVSEFNQKKFILKTLARKFNFRVQFSEDLKLPFMFNTERFYYKGKEDMPTDLDVFYGPCAGLKDFVITAYNIKSINYIHFDYNKKSVNFKKYMNEAWTGSVDGLLKMYESNKDKIHPHRPLKKELELLETAFGNFDIMKEKWKIYQSNNHLYYHIDIVQYTNKFLDIVRKHAGEKNYLWFSDIITGCNETVYGYDYLEFTLNKILNIRNEINIAFEYKDLNDDLILDLI